MSPKDKDKKKAAQAPEAPPAAEAAEPPIDLTALRQEVEEILRQKDEYYGMLQRTTADFENYKKRNASLRTESLAEGRLEAVLAMLPVLDNLERALESAGEADRDGALMTGVDMVAKQLIKALSDMGVEAIPSEPGDPFDPHQHNAVMTVPSDGEHPDNTIFDTLQKGYRMGDKVARYAMVRVAKDE